MTPTLVGLVVTLIVRMAFATVALTLGAHLEPAISGVFYGLVAASWVVAEFGVAATRRNL